jgi:hypothetical protein
MKINTTLAVVLGILGALGGVSHDMGKYRDAVNAAKATSQPVPAYDFASTLSDAVTSFTAAFTAALGISQIPGV